MRRANIPERFWDATPDQVKGNNKWMRQALGQPDLWAEKGYGFYLHGPFNTGKSAAACILARDFVLRAHKVLFLKVCDVPRTRFHDGAEGVALDTRLRHADLLVLDDLGSERFRLDSAAGAALEEVVRIMYDRSRPIVITSNKAWEGEFPASYGSVPAFVSVVQRICISVALVDPWPDGPSLGIQ
jgi:DNA replication protein DnaC